MSNIIEKPAFSLHQVRQSLWVLSFKIIIALFSFATVYGVLLILFLYVGVDTSYVSEFVLSTTTIAFVVLWATQIFLSVLQGFVILYIILHWARTVYYITDDQLILYRGILKLDEQAYRLNNFHSIKLHQSFIGKIFQFGTITIEIKPTPGVTNIFHIRLVGIPNPKMYERTLRQYLRDMDKIASV